SAAKAALNKLTGDMAKDVGRFGATANGIGVGTARSAAITIWLTGLAKKHGWPGSYDDWEHRFLSEMQPQQAIKKFADPKDIAALAVFLASPRAAQLTGVTIRMDSGSSSSVH